MCAHNAIEVCSSSPCVYTMLWKCVAPPCVCTQCCRSVAPQTVHSVPCREQMLSQGPTRQKPGPTIWNRSLCVQSLLDIKTLKDVSRAETLIHWAEQTRKKPHHPPDFAPALCCRVFLRAPLFYWQFITPGGRQRSSAAGSSDVQTKSI